jgi:hypothetical protein
MLIKMKKLSYKDLIIALGILVAAFIIVTSVYFKGPGSNEKAVKINSEKKIKPAAILNQVVQKLTSSTVAL